jgi:hypothetical protein
MRVATVGSIEHLCFASHEQQISEAVLPRVQNMSASLFSAVISGLRRFDSPDANHESNQQIAAFAASQCASFVNMVVLNTNLMEDDSAGGSLESIIAVMELSFRLIPGFRLYSWSQMRTNPSSPLLAVYQYAASRFPFSYRPFVMVVSALLHEHDNAIIAQNDAVVQGFSYLQRLTSLTTLCSNDDVADPNGREHTRSLRDLRLNEGTAWNPLRPFSVALSSSTSITIPVKTRGTLQESNDIMSVVRWEHSCSAWRILVRSLEFATNFIDGLAQLNDDDQRASSVALIKIVSVISSVYRSPSIVPAFEEHVAVGDATSSATPIVSLVRLLVRCTEASGVHIPLVEAILSGLAAIARHSPTLVWPLMKEFGFITSTAGCLRRFLYNNERRVGQYSATIAHLHLLRVLVLSGSISAEDEAVFQVYLRFVMHDIFSDFESWKFQNASAKAQLGLQVARLFRAIVGQSDDDIAPVRILTSVRMEMLRDLRDDSNATKSLLNIVSRGEIVVEKLYRARLSSQARTYTMLIEESFHLLLAALDSVDASQGKPASQLERSILFMQTIVNDQSWGNIIIDISRYVLQTRSSSLPVLATNILAKVCRFANPIASSNIPDMCVFLTPWNTVSACLPWTSVHPALRCCHQSSGIGLLFAPLSPQLTFAEMQYSSQDCTSIVHPRSCCQPAGPHGAAPRR